MSGGRKSLLAPNPRVVSAVVPIRQADTAASTPQAPVDDTELQERLALAENRAADAERLVQRRKEEARKQQTALEQAQAALLAQGSDGTARNPRVRKRDGLNMKRCSVWLPSEWDTPLKAFGRDEGLNRNEIIERAMRQLLGDRLP